MAAALLFLLTRGSINDDAYITLAYAKNLALHLHWGLIPQETANTATSPLTVALIAALSFVTRVSGDVHPVVALGVLVVGAGAAAAYGWTRVVRALGLPWGAAAIAVALAFVDPFLSSAVGLEVVFIPALLVILLAMALEGRVVGFGVAAGVMVLTRLDLVLFVVLVGIASVSIRRGWLRAATVAAAVAGPWFVASWILLGSAIPDTLIIKVDQTGAFGERGYLTGFVNYLDGRPWEVALALAPAVLGLIAMAVWLAWRLAARLPRAGTRWHRAAGERLAPVVAVGAGGIAYYALYSALSVPPYHWYYVAPIAAFSLVAVAFGGALARATAGARWRSFAGVAPLGMLAALAVAGAVGVVAHGIPWRAPIIFGNAASAHDYARVGLALRRRIGPEGVASPGEIGTLAYFCECPIIDEFSDRGRVVQRVNSHLDRGSALKRALLRVNYLWLDRDQKPRQPRYALAYGLGPGSGPDSWTVWSAAFGIGHFTLVPPPPPG